MAAPDVSHDRDGVGELRFAHVGQDDPLAGPLLDELASEYANRYGGTADAVSRWLRTYPADEFADPGGALVVGLLGGEPVTGGAFRDYGTVDGVRTAELKRIWTSSLYRRRGLAKLLLDHLEREIIARGYGRVYLTTGDRQPEAERLYETCGYTRLPGPLPGEGEVYPVAFAKDLP